jgi:hypothetical protein
MHWSFCIRITTSLNIHLLRNDAKSETSDLNNGTPSRHLESRGLAVMVDIYTLSSSDYMINTNPSPTHNIHLSNYPTIQSIPNDLTQPQSQPSS